MTLLPRLGDDRLFGAFPIGPVGEDAQGGVERGRRQDHQTEPAAVDDQHGQHADGHDAVEDRLNEVGRQRLLNRGQRAEPRNDVADMTLLEIVERQTGQVVEQAAVPLEVQLGAGQHDGPGSRDAERELDQQQKRQSDRDDEEQVEIRVDDHLVDDDLRRDRHQQRDALDPERKNQDLRERRADPGDVAEQVGETQAGRGLLAHEAGGRAEFQHHPGEIARHLVERQPAATPGGVMNDDRMAADALQGDEMVQAPVQDAGQAQPPDILEFDAQRPRRHVHLAGEIHHVAQRHPFQGQDMPTTQTGKVDMATVIAEHHGEAGHATLGRLGLQNHREPAPEPKLQLVDDAQCGAPWVIKSVLRFR